MARFLPATLLALAILLLGGALPPLCAEERAHFGIELDNLTSERARELKLAAAGGVLVTGTQRGSPAERSGLRAGDVILAIGGVAIDQATAVVGALGGRQPGARIKMTVWRAGARIELAATMGRLPEAFALL